MEAVSRKWKNLCRGGCGGRGAEGGGEENCLKNERRGKLLFKIEGGKIIFHRQEGGLIDS